jgi:hypothetical protein
MGALGEWLNPCPRSGPASYGAPGFGISCDVFRLRQTIYMVDETLDEGLTAV